MVAKGAGPSTEQRVWGGGAVFISSLDSGKKNGGKNVGLWLGLQEKILYHCHWCWYSTNSFEKNSLIRAKKTKIWRTCGPFKKMNCCVLNNNKIYDRNNHWQTLVKHSNIQYIKKCVINTPLKSLVVIFAKWNVAKKFIVKIPCPQNIFVMTSKHFQTNWPQEGGIPHCRRKTRRKNIQNRGFIPYGTEIKPPLPIIYASGGKIVRGISLFWSSFCFRG